MAKEDQELLRQFVQCFSYDGGQPEYEGDLVIPQLTDAASLELIYAAIPIRFPSLLEKLLLSYRWYGADTNLCRVFPNPPGEDLTGFLSHMRSDKIMFEFCLQNGFVLFGLGPDMRHHAVCFDARKSAHGRKYPVVKLDHEQILCNSRIKIMEQLAKNFDELVTLVVNQTNID